MSSTATEIALQPLRAHPPASQDVEEPLRLVSSRNANADISSNKELSRAKSITIISSVTFITGINSLLNGAVTIGLPTMARDVGLSQGLLFWPSSIYSLTCGCTLLLCGALADLFGAWQLYTIGCVLQSLTILAGGLSKSGIQLIVFRGLAGVATSMCLPSAVSIITSSFLPGQSRNAAFASMGGGQPVGFGLGLTLGGVFADTIGWRWSFYIAAILNTMITAAVLFTGPVFKRQQRVTWDRFVSEVDFVGALLASSALGMVAYVLAALTDDSAKIADAVNITLLSLSAVSLGAFIFWTRRQEKLGRPAILPNSLWKDKVFTSICVIVFLVWGSFNAAEAFASLLFQYVLKRTAIQTALYMLPAAIGGLLTSVCMGVMVHRVRADATSLVAVVIATLAPVFFAVAKMEYPYWALLFPGILANAVGADSLYTISNLLITSLFPSQTQGVAGGVYNTVAQIGRTFGLATSAIIASSVTLKSKGAAEETTDDLLKGYHAAFWYCVALNGAALVAVVWGLRKIGKIGLKQD